jgi:hypothetical protein
LGPHAANLRRGAQQIQSAEKEQKELAALLAPLEKDIVDK